MRAFLTDDPLCRPRTDGHETWFFHSAVGFKDEAGKEWWTQPDFETDGASIPKLLRVFFGHPFRSNYIRPAALHDFYYASWSKVFVGRTAGLARKAVDQMFLEAALEDGVCPDRAWMFYLGVRIGGWLPWRKHAKAQPKQVSGGT